MKKIGKYNLTIILTQNLFNIGAWAGGVSCSPCVALTLMKLVVWLNDILLMFLLFEFAQPNTNIGKPINNIILVIKIFFG
jgi:hypothetical protein